MLLQVAAYARQPSRSTHPGGSGPRSVLDVCLALTPARRRGIPAVDPARLPPVWTQRLYLSLAAGSNAPFALDLWPPDPPPAPAPLATPLTTPLEPSWSDSPLVDDFGDLDSCWSQVWRSSPTQPVHVDQPGHPPVPEPLNDTSTAALLTALTTRWRVERARAVTALHVGDDPAGAVPAPSGTSALLFPLLRQLAVVSPPAAAVLHQLQGGLWCERRDGVSGAPAVAALTTPAIARYATTNVPRLLSRSSRPGGLAPDATVVPAEAAPFGRPELETALAVQETAPSWELAVAAAAAVHAHPPTHGPASHQTRNRDRVA